MCSGPAPAAPFLAAAGEAAQPKQERSPPGDRRAWQRSKPLAPETERVVTGGNGGGTQNLKASPHGSPEHRSSFASLCAARPGGAGRAGLRYVGNGPEEGWGERERGKGTIGALPPFAKPRPLSCRWKKESPRPGVWDSKAPCYCS
ncbi:hypothetical protein D7X33_12570 [Butyricicoccus sp. 1XD8-22]|nr:hypothetical protein D7X33_12570 [Butyricicoccus sp. 1XD8-22]